MAIFRRWATDRGLRPSRPRTSPAPGTADRCASAAAETMPSSRLSDALGVTELSEAKVRRLADKQSQPPDLVVVSATRDWTCTTCSDTGDLLFMEGPGPLCLRSADLDHLVYLPAGDPALTRRAKKASGLSAVVVRFSRTRGHYERQGLLVEEDALVRTEGECLADEEARRRRRGVTNPPRRARRRVPRCLRPGDRDSVPRLPTRACRHHRPPRHREKERTSRPQRRWTRPRSGGRHPRGGRVGASRRHPLRPVADGRDPGPRPVSGCVPTCKRVLTAGRILSPDDARKRGGSSTGSPENRLVHDPDVSDQQDDTSCEACESRPGAAAILSRHGRCPTSSDATGPRRLAALRRAPTCVRPPARISSSRRSGVLAS